MFICDGQKSCCILCAKFFTGLIAVVSGKFSSDFRVILVSLRRIHTTARTQMNIYVITEQIFYTKRRFEKSLLQQ